MGQLRGGKEGGEGDAGVEKRHIVRGEASAGHCALLSAAVGALVARVVDVTGDPQQARRDDRRKKGEDKQRKDE